jgi:hypothetical protein
VGGKEDGIERKEGVEGRRREKKKKEGGRD